MALPSKPIDTTLDYYDRNADAFTARTINDDLAAEYDAFLKHLTPSAHILDAGCGSGRDARRFLDMGYQVTAFDGSIEMATRATEHTGLPVAHLRFEDIAYDAEFDGIWACATLLHIARSTLPQTITRLARGLKPDGTLYMSMKHGNDEQCIEGRHFTFVDEASMQTLLDACPELTPLRIWSSTEHYDDGSSQVWVHGLARRTTA
ncbi:MAG: class I SAM-dependent methyltransferase [Phycisphaerales bacterium]|nr:class I SAM-dependent methyltransferase [Phycisphaerales bacterium]